MSVSKTLNETARTIPESGETGWGAETTGLLGDSTDNLNAVTTQVAGNPVPKLAPTTTILAAGGTLTQTHPLHRLQSTSGEAVLDGTTAIADGTVDGQVVSIEGTSNTNYVVIPDGANTDINGAFYGVLGAVLRLVWNSSRGLWVEHFRSDR